MMVSSYSSAMLLTILVLGGALVEAAGRPFGSWTDTTSLDNPEDVGDIKEEGMTIPSFLHNYVSSLDPEKMKQYVASLEEHTLSQHSLEFCQDANLMCNSDIAIEDPKDADEDDEIFQNSSNLDSDTQNLSFGEKDIVEGQDIVFPQSLQGSTYSSPSFLPHSLAEKMPFSSEKIFELLDTLGISHNSKLATMMSRTISRCELTKEKSSKEITISNEKEIKEKDIEGIDFIEKEKTGKGTKVKKEKSSKKEVKKKDTEWNIEEVNKGTYVKGGEKEFTGKGFKEREVEKEELEVKKEREFEKKDIEWTKEEDNKRKFIEGEEKKDEEFKDKEFEKKEFEVKKEKSSQEKDVKKKDIEWNKDKDIEGKVTGENEFKKKDIKEREAKVTKEKVVEEKEIEVTKAKSSKETLKCVMSLEGMTSFVKRSLPSEKHIKALETSSFSKFGDHKKVRWKVSKVKKHEKAVVCKKEVFPFAVFKCHIISKTNGVRIYHIKLEDKDGVYRKEILVCADKKKSCNGQQYKTRIAPRSKVSCRWIPDSLIWVPNV